MQKKYYQRLKHQQINEYNLHFIQAMEARNKSDLNQFDIQIASLHLRVNFKYELFFTIRAFSTLVPDFFCLNGTSILSEL